MKFSRKVLLSIAMACIICTTAAVLVSANRVKHFGEEELKEKSQAILSRLVVVQDYIASQGGLNISIEHALKNYPDGNLPKDAKLTILKQVPIFAAMQVGSVGAEEEGYKFRIFSDEPRNKDNAATASELEILKRFEADPKLKDIVEVNDKEVVVYHPVRLAESQGCLSCHGDPKTSPWGNGKDILGHQMENWKDGKLHGAFAIISNKAEIEAAVAKSTWYILGWSAALALVAMFLGYLTLKKPMQALSGIAEKLEEAGTGVSSASTNINSASQSLSESSMSAASSIEETTAATEQMSSMIKLNAEHTVEAKNLAEIAQTKVRSGRSDVENLIQSMNEITKSSRKIEEIITVIDDIAFQTNLLALNAAVEAARAGEQGKGFAVVADAVRSLAQRSATSAKEISGLISESVTKIQEGHKAVISSETMLTEIVGQIEKLTALNIEISNASTEQSQGVSSINAAINELDGVTQNNALSAQKCAEAAGQLTERSNEMHAMMQELVGIVEGKKAA